MISALGGAANLREIDACTTRLRLRVADQKQVDEPALKALGAAGVLRPGSDSVQVIIGLRADEIASNMREAVGGTAKTELESTQAGRSLPSEQGVNADVRLAPALLRALGGEANVVMAEGFGTRISVELRDIDSVDEAQLRIPGFRGIAKLGAGRVQVLASGNVGGLTAELLRLAR